LPGEETVRCSTVHQDDEACGSRFGLSHHRQPRDARDPRDRQNEEATGDSPSRSSGPRARH
jgi:hypothetical protein